MKTTFEKEFKLATDYAVSQHMQIVHYIHQDGVFYFRIDYKVRPRYLGLPIYIYINRLGEVTFVDGFQRILTLEAMATTIGQHV